MAKRRGICGQHAHRAGKIQGQVRKVKAPPDAPHDRVADAVAGTGSSSGLIAGGGGGGSGPVGIGGGGKGKAGSTGLPSGLAG